MPPLAGLLERLRHSRAAKLYQRTTQALAARIGRQSMAQAASRSFASFHDSGVGVFLGKTREETLRIGLGVLEFWC